MILPLLLLIVIVHRRKHADREILLLPFRATEALVPGQSVSIVLKEGRYMDLFQDCIDDHCSILGMALLGEDAILQAMVLCEIDDFRVDAGFRGKVTVQVTLRAVGRATVREITQMKPVMMAIGRELVDEQQIQHRLARRVFSNRITIRDDNIKSAQRYSVDHSGFGKTSRV